MSEPHGLADRTAPACLPGVTVAIPSLNQGRFIEATLRSVFEQDVPVAVNLMDAGSTDETLQVVEPWKERLTRFRSGPDGGQAQAINEGLAHAQTPYVAWLNADDVYLPGGLSALSAALDAHPEASFAYGQARLIDESGGPCGNYHVEPWSRDRFARRCFVSQPATLIRRRHWEAVRGLDASLHMALDYDLWWRLAAVGQPVFVDRPVAVTRIHVNTKTMQRPVDHYREAMAVVRRHYGRLPLWWWVKAPMSIGARALFGRQIGYRKDAPG